MITKRQAQHLKKLVEAYAEAYANQAWQDDQGWVRAEIEQATKDTHEAKEKVAAYLIKLTATD